MNPSTRKALERVLRALEKPPKVVRLSRAPIVLGTALALAQQLLTQLVPAVWRSTLPGGLMTANRLRGWPGLVWALDGACPRGWIVALAVGVGMSVVGVVLCKKLPILKLLVWPAALAAVLLNGAILYVTMATAHAAATSGMGSPEVFAPESFGP